MADTGLKHRSGGFAFRPASLPRNEGDRNPMVGNNRVRDADHADRHNEEKPRTESQGGRASEILGELLQFAHGGLGVGLGPFKTMLEMVVDQFTFGVADGALDREELLGDLNAGLGVLDHRDNGAQMALRALEPLRNFRMAGVLHAGLL